MFFLAAVCYFPFLGHAQLFDWDEINFAECAREMVVTGNYFLVQIDYAPFWEKPPLFIWMQVLCMKVFGINEFAARLPNAICGTITILVLYLLGNKQRDKAFGFLWAGIYLSTVLASVYFKSGIIDPVFNLFIFLSIYQMVCIEQKEGNLRNKAIYAGLFMGLATLTKGPVGLLIPMLVFVVYRVVTFNFKLPWKSIFILLGTFILITGTWFGLMMLKDPKLMQQFWEYQVRLFKTEDAGHGQPFFYHFVVFLIGCFPMAAFTFRGQFVRPTNNTELVLHRYMNVLFWVVLILFSIVKTKIVHYSSLLYFPGAYAATQLLYRLISAAKSPLGWEVYVLYLLDMLVFGVATALVPWIAQHPENIQALIKDDFGKQNVMMPVMWHWSIGGIGLIFLIGMSLGLYYLHRKKILLMMFTWMITMILWLNLVNYFIVPRVQQYSQGVPVAFFESKAGQNCYLYTWQYKSYAHYFYGKRPQNYPVNGRNQDFLLKAKLDKPVFFVSKSNRVKDLLQYCDSCSLVSQKAGFAIYKRNPTTN